MDRSLWIKLFNISLYLFIAGHLLLLTIYVLPHERASNALVGISDLYMSRLFHQEWDLFAPEPPIDSFEVSYVIFDQFKVVLDTVHPFENALKKHLSGTSITATKEVYMGRRHPSNVFENYYGQNDGSKEHSFSAVALKYYCLEHVHFNYPYAAFFQVHVLKNGFKIMYFDLESTGNEDQWFY